MLKKLMIGTALGALALSGAHAQSNPGNSSPSSPPAMKSDSASTPAAPSSSSSSMSSPSAGSSTTGQASPPASPSSASASMPASAGQKFVSSQSPDQLLATKFTGTDVVGSDDKKIGDVTDVLFDKHGKIMAYVVGVGGFLGIGSKNVALEPSAFQAVKGENNSADKLKLSMTREELEKAPNFEAYKESSRTTTGSGGTKSSSGAMGGGSRPAPSPAPATK